MSNTISNNKKVSFDYFIEETYECGVVLEGWEVKAARLHNVRVQEAYVKVVGGELWLINSSFTPNTTSSENNLDKINTTRSRKLLLKKAEISKLFGKITRGGMTLVPMEIYWSKNNIKLRIALAKGKKQYDKRATLKEKDVTMEISRTLKNRVKNT